MRAPTRQTPARAAALKRRQAAGNLDADADWHIEPQWAVRALLAEEPFHGRVHDPACGAGFAVKAALSHGLHATGSDLIARGTQGEAWFAGVADFLAGDPERAERHDNILCNPPYGRGVLAKAFIERARLVARRKVAMIVPLPYLAGNVRSGRYELYTKPHRMPLACVYVCSDRPSMPPGGLYMRGMIKAEGGTEDYCWLVFREGHRGDATIRFVLNSDRAATSKRRTAP